MRFLVVSRSEVDSMAHYGSRAADRRDHFHVSEPIGAGSRG